jgi:hypothetical protein
MMWALAWGGGIPMRSDMKASGDMKARARLTRGFETWQFFAFVFMAAVTLEIALISAISCVWIRLGSDTLAFVGTFYIVMLNGCVRNWLAGVLPIIKEER